MSKNFDLSYFGSKISRPDLEGSFCVGIGTTVKIVSGGLMVGGSEVIDKSGNWTGPASGISGAQGDAGTPGAQGDTGNQGSAGAQGDAGTPGAQGDTGNQGAPGAGGPNTIDDYITHNGDTDTKFGFSAADTFSVETAGSERVRVSSAGSFGIGTNDPKTPLHVVGIPTGSGGKDVARFCTDPSDSSLQQSISVGFSKDVGDEHPMKEWVLF